MNKRRGKPAPRNATPEEAYHAALKTAFHILGYQDNTEAQIRDKLTERGYSPETVENVVAFLLTKSYLDESRMLHRAVRSLAEGKLYGKLRIRQELARKRYRPDVLASLDWEGEELGDLDFAAICYTLLRKRGGERDEKTYAYLRRYGHSNADIKEAYRRLKEDGINET